MSMRQFVACSKRACSEQGSDFWYFRCFVLQLKQYSTILVQPVVSVCMSCQKNCILPQLLYPKISKVSYLRYETQLVNVA